MSDEISNPIQYFSTYPDKINTLKNAYERAYQDAISCQQVCFEGQLLDLRYCKHLIDAIDREDIKGEVTLDETLLATFKLRREVKEAEAESNKLLCNLYGVESEQELEDLLNDRANEGGNKDGKEVHQEGS